MMYHIPTLNASKAQAPVFAEVDRLSAAWETLDRQVQSKVFELKGMEDRVVKINLDVCFFLRQDSLFNSLWQKAKSDNKFYAAMRDKEAIENERKNLARNLEKQGKVVERLVESERNLSAQVVSLLCSSK
jgi:E3 ubiquitin-protein ligase BRE1